MMHRAKPQEPPQDQRDVRAKHTPIGVELINRDHPKRFQKLRPMRVSWQNSRVQHIGVRQDDVRQVAD